ncbi:phosphoribosylanthranilate isomerase [Anditalea andensis]|uniref:N-(5'-phosphoribosyl)anthranilate isomerase n=1 Tax=Anditalea andensis TaxID=1048983 RepID=A0A074LJB3_9BACT|nr:phosphoribosylanthranilate isomerase [Anditalea andensis]KEO73902.1 hypothetical protein EL17_10400 [Anditalea andensis]
MLIKVCGLKDTDNVEKLLSPQCPDLLGMIFYEKSQRYIGSIPFTVRGEVNRPIATVGVFVNTDIDVIIDRQRIFGFGWVQLHGDEAVSYIRELRERTDLKIIKVFRVSDKLDENKMAPYEPWVDYFLFDTQTPQYGGSGYTFDWQILEAYSLNTPFILSGGIDLGHTTGLISMYNSHPKMAGIDINSRFETIPGIKDPDKVAQFINIIRENTTNQISYDRNR